LLFILIFSVSLLFSLLFSLLSSLLSSLFSFPLLFSSLHFTSLLSSSLLSSSLLSSSLLFSPLLFSPLLSYLLSSLSPPLSHKTMHRSCCHNIILGSLWLDHYGDLTITNHTTGDKCLMKFQKAGYFGAGRYVVSGEVFDKDGNLKYAKSGHTLCSLATHTHYAHFSHISTFFLSTLSLTSTPHIHSHPHAHLTFFPLSLSFSNKEIRIKLRGKWNDSLYASRVDGEEYLVWESENKAIDNKYRYPYA
jgi:Oxysterol-binding protein